jgi:ATP-dependent helicase/nuclease subunit A
MTATTENNQTGDALDRLRAVTTFDANIVVTAGAGTGKTTLLVDRLVHLLVRNPRPLKITEIVALTFTNKAATEMKLRLRARLQSYVDLRLDREARYEGTKTLCAEVRALTERYQLSKEEIDARLREALRNIERSEIGTIHSFAATLLRLYPMEAGVDPQFREDDGREFDRLFREQWDLWLNQELSRASARADDWKKILRSISLDQMKSIAESLCSETIVLHAPPVRVKARHTRDRLGSWLTGLETRSTALVERHPEERLNEKLVRAARTLIRATGPAARNRGDDVEDAKSLLLSGKSIARNVNGWGAQDIEEARDLVRVAKGLCQIDPELTALLWELLIPFADTFREFFVHEGFVSFDGLLIRARNLVRDHGHVREELKRQFQAILIDEFQDTEPIQYEILIYLAEQIGRRAKEWRHVRLTPGKIFVVGDPKQSIYAFRRADIEAYLEVVEKMIKAQEGIECRLTTNFRSHAAILDVVNGIFESLMRPKKGIQPAYIGIQAPQPKSTNPEAEDRQTPLAKVVIRKIVPENELGNTAQARRLEAESLARWLKQEILGKTVIFNPWGQSATAQPKDIAILFRKLTGIQDYIEPLRRHGIRYVVEGERHFYTVKEVIDTVNLLRAVENPYDRLALVGVLRSPLGGVTDQVIYELHRANGLDYREWKRLDESRFPSTIQELYKVLDQLHTETQILPVGEAITHIYNSLPLIPLAGCGFHGEQAVANLEKLKQQAELLGAEGCTTLKDAIYQLQRRVLDVKEEGESVLTEETLDAVRIMSVHKAKGLEFPMVVLAGCQMGTETGLMTPAEALFDWSANLTGLRVGPIWNLAGLYITEKARLRAEEEQKRVLYVAMTRAREHLVLSCVPTARRSSGSFIALLDPIVENRIERAERSNSVPIGNGMMEICVVHERLVAPGRHHKKRRTSRETQDWKTYTQTWMRRRERYESVRKMSLFVSPTLLRRQEQAWSARAATKTAPVRRTAALAVGGIAHRFLQHWDYGGDSRSFSDQLEPFLDRWVPLECQSERDFIREELHRIFGDFFGSNAYTELAEATILGREVPLLMPWNGQVMEGVIDLIYERAGLLYLADYKTDRISRAELARAAQYYGQQAQIYSRAAHRSLNRKVAAFKLIFLRLGEAIAVDLA